MSRREEYTYLDGEREDSSNQIQGRNVTESAPSEGDILVWDATNSEYRLDRSIVHLDGGAADTSFRFSPIQGGDAATSSFNITYFCGDATTF